MLTTLEGDVYVGTDFGYTTVLFNELLREAAESIDVVEAAQHALQGNASARELLNIRAGIDDNTSIIYPVNGQIHAARDVRKDYMYNVVRLGDLKFRKYPVFTRAAMLALQGSKVARILLNIKLQIEEGLPIDYPSNAQEVGRIPTDGDN